MSEHSPRSASGAVRWMACAASVRMEDGKPDTSNEYAEEGTATHEVGENCLKHDTDATKYIGKRTGNGVAVTEAMADYVQQYVDYVRLLPGDHLIEQRVDFSPWVPGGYGTSDCIAITDNAIWIVDLKYGQGNRVFAQDNPQAYLYGLGVLNTFSAVCDAVNTVHLIIVQPRLDHIDTHTMSVSELLEWGKVVNAHALATLDPDAPFNPGEKACQWCKAAGECAALAEHALNVAIEEFTGFEPNMITKDVDTLSPEDIATLLPQLKTLITWAKTLEGHALTLLSEGKPVPGYKLVEGRSFRAWRDEIEAAVALLKSGIDPEKLYTKKIISPAVAEKLVGKTNPIMTEQVMKPHGKPTIAPMADKREAITTPDLSNDFDGFGD